MVRDRLDHDRSTETGQISDLPVQPRSQKYPAFVFSQITCISAAVPFPLGGAARDRHGRWEWDAVDATRAQDEARLLADGEAVWS
jgi:hypothetical protein